jgi:ribose transport system permease protein
LTPKRGVTVPMSQRLDRTVVAVVLSIPVLLVAGALYDSRFLSPDYLLLQLQVASFLGVIATGLMPVVLLGHIDLSIPWVVTIGGMMATAAAEYASESSGLPLWFALLCGLGVGLLNGAGVAYLRVPSMILTLATNAIAQGLMILHTSGFAPQDRASPAMHFLAVQRSVAGIPNSLWVWGAVGALMMALLTRTTFGRAVYSVGNNQRAAFLSRVNVNAVTVACFAISGSCAAFAGALLAGYSSKAYQAMGDPYLLPAIAAVVLGGTSISGGRGSYPGTIAGVIVMTLLQSILSVAQLPESARQIIHGVIIIAMLLVHAHGRKSAQ